MPCSHFEWETQSDRLIGKVWNFKATTSVFLLKLGNVRSIFKILLKRNRFFFYRWRDINVKCSFKYRVQVTQTITNFQTKCPCTIFNKFCVNDISFFHKINLHDDRLILFFLYSLPNRLLLILLYYLKTWCYDNKIYDILP